jgi:KDO2-lipid IV(A) lauroyltransferase
VVHRLFAGIVWLAACTVAALPIAVAYALADVLAVPWALFWALQDRRGRRSKGYWRNRRVVCRPGSPLPSLPPGHLWAWSRHMTWLVVDFCRIRAISAANLGRFFDAAGFLSMRAILAEGKGMIFATGHVGTWDLGGHAAALLGYPLLSVYRPSPVPAFDRLLLRLRAIEGRTVVAKSGMVRVAKRALEAGNVLAILCDGGAKGSEVTAPFLGVDANTVATPAVLHLMTGAPIVVASFPRLGRSRFTVECWDVIRHPPSGDRDADVLAITRRLNAALTKAIVAHPEQWFWHGRRFRHRPAGEVALPDGLPPLAGGAA